MSLFGWLILFGLAIWVFERLYLRGRAVKAYPPPAGSDVAKRFVRAAEPGPEHLLVNKVIRELTLRIVTHMHNKDIESARAVFDTISAGREYRAEFIPTDADGVPAEWVIAPGADRNNRVLYIHGGGFVTGSPLSHRPITSKFSEVSGCAVLAIDYRLMPEHHHGDCVEDCRTAYRWILGNGPDGAGEIRQLFIGGDSAGGNLCLSLIAWIRDNGLRAPDAAVALSPLTDITFSGASIRDNVDSDIMLKPFMKPLVKLPKFIKSWWVLWNYKVRPCSAQASPLLGDLSNLPPTLVQASEAEMLLDDARRYVYKAYASGSPAKLQTWTGAVHIWQMFEPQLPEAVEAWLEIGKYLKSVSRSGPG